ncbi:hypothetical protein B4113_4127 [Geobacillus sp. B4113_201601]|nr:hypothetical protein B4113_4127 [Geobacillus sp. B4113_201601]
MEKQKRFMGSAICPSPMDENPTPVRHFHGKQVNSAAKQSRKEAGTGAAPFCCGLPDFCIDKIRQGLYRKRNSLQA